MIQIKEIYWIAAFLEGEGSFFSTLGSLVCSAGQVQKWPLVRLQSLLGGKIRPRPPGKTKNAKPSWIWVLNVQKSAALMMTLYPLMSPDRQAQIRKALKKWRTVSNRSKYSKNCLHGHPRTPQNTLYDKSRWRRCKICAENWNETRRLQTVTKKKSLSKSQLGFRF